jgi:catechol-2,3-dioxygenase
VGRADLDRMFEKGKKAGIETRGISDHGFIDSIYFRDPNGYVIELTCKRPDHDQIIAKARTGAHDQLARWQKEKVGRTVP